MKEILDMLQAISVLLFYIASRVGDPDEVKDIIKKLAEKEIKGE